MVIAAAAATAAVFCPFSTQLLVHDVILRRLDAPGEMKPVKKQVGLQLSIEGGPPPLRLCVAEKEITAFEQAVNSALEAAAAELDDPPPPPPGIIEH